MRRWVGLAWFGLVSMGLAAACATVEDTVRPGPPEAITFGPPAGRALVERWVERRAVQLSFPDRPDQMVVEIHAGITEERWQPLPDGGFRIVSVVREQGSSRNGVPLPLPVPIQGVEFAHRVDAEGRLVAVEDPVGTAFELQERIREQRAREMLEALFTPEFVTQRITQGWEARTAGLCNVELAPGAATDGVLVQELPTSPPLALLVRERLLGFEDGPDGRVAVFGSRLAGRNARWIDDASVQPLLDGLPEGKGSLAPRAEGRGTRLVSTRTCLVTRESSTVRGTVPVDRKAAEAQGLQNFPDRIEFRIDREVTREPAR